MWCYLKYDENQRMSCVGYIVEELAGTMQSHARRVKYNSHDRIKTKLGGLVLQQWRRV